MTLAGLARRSASSASPCCTASPGAARPRSICASPASVVAAGRRVLVLVPEIALTPAVARDLPERAFGDRVAIQHSAPFPGCTPRSVASHPPRRGRTWWSGTRSAVFAPLDGAGAGDRRRGARYVSTSRRTAPAITRAASRSCARSAPAPWPSSVRPRLRWRPFTTPAAAATGCVVQWRERVHRRPLPGGAGGRHACRDGEPMPGRTWWSAGPSPTPSRSTLARGEQALILLNRRGFAAAVLCRQCGRTLECPNCSVSLTLHRGARAACVATTATTRRARPSTCARLCGTVSGVPSASAPSGSRRTWRNSLPGASASRVSTAIRSGAGARRPSLLARFREGAK